MSDIRSKLQDFLIQPIARVTQAFTTVGKVTASDEINNICSVQYIDRNGNRRRQDNVVVRLYDNGSGYFPAIGDYVEIQLDRDICVIIARHIANYNMDVRSKMTLRQDIYSDSPGTDPGGSIF